MHSLTPRAMLYIVHNGVLRQPLNGRFRSEVSSQLRKLETGYGLGVRLLNLPPLRLTPGSPSRSEKKALTYQGWELGLESGPYVTWCEASISSLGDGL